MDSKDLARIVETHSRVILPDFGAFLLKDSGSGTFTPGNLTFSPFLKYNDNVLEEALAKHREIPKDEAIRQVRVFVESIREAIKTQGYFDIPAIGKLTRDSRGAIAFTAHGASPAQPEPGRQAGSRPSSRKRDTPQVAPGADAERQTEDVQNTTPSDTPAGVDTPQPHSEERTESAPPTELPPPPETIANDEVSGGTPNEPSQPPAPPASLSSETTNNPKNTADMAKTKTKKKSKITLALTLIYLAVSLTVILAIAFVIREMAFSNAVEETGIPQDSGNEIVKKASVEVDSSAPASTAPKDELDMAFDAMSTDETPQKAKNSTSLETQIEKSVVENASARQPPAGSFYLVAGSFNDKLNAEKYVKELKTQGYKAGVLTLDNGKNYVTVGAFPSKSGATEEKERLAQEFPNIWILKR